MLKSPEFTKLNVSVPDFVKGLDQVLADSDMSAVQDYLAWHYIHASARLLSKALVDENFDFYGRTLTGTEQQKPRWKRCVSATDDELGEALGRKFVEKTFGAEGKDRTLKMVGEIELQMGRDIDSLTWMSPETKKEAHVKLQAVTNKIGYPDKWRDYSSIEIVASDYFNNWYRANEFENKRQLDKIGQPVDRAEWAMTPPTVNAYYDPTQNNINFPAGILQPPFYSNKAGDAVNYGAVGHVIGHELTHAFDDEGRQFDAEGNLKNWWRKNDETEFKKLADCFVNEYGSFSPVPGIELNGRLTLGENTADNGGVRLAYLALLDDLTKEKKPLNSEVDGYTEAQQFFLGFAQVWCENQRPEESRLLAQTDPHSPTKFRVDGVVPNLPEFSAAFGCKAPDPMFCSKGMPRLVRELMKEQLTENPLLIERFPIEFEAVKAEHVEPAIQLLLEQMNQRLAALGSPDTPRTYQDILLALDQMTEPLDFAMALVRHLESVVTTPELRAAHNAVQGPVSAFYTSIALNENLWKAVQAVNESGEKEKLAPVHRRYLHKTVRASAGPALIWTRQARNNWKNSTSP